MQPLPTDSLPLTATYYYNKTATIFNCSKAIIATAAEANITIQSATDLFNFLFVFSNNSTALQQCMQAATTHTFTDTVTIFANTAPKVYTHTIEIFERNEFGEAIVISGVFTPAAQDNFVQENYNKTLAELEKKELLLNEVCKLTKVGGWEVNLNTMECIWSKEVYKIHEVDESFMPNVASGINFYHPSYMPIITQKFAELINEAIPYDVELKFITAKKRIIWVRTIGVPIVDEQKKVVGVRGVFQDIDKDRKTQDYLNNYFQYAADALVVCNKNACIKETSPSFEKMIGYTIEELSNTTIYKLLHTEDVQQIKQKLATAYNTASTEITARFKTKYNNYVWLSWNIIQQEEGFLAIVRNISLQKKKEEEIELLNKYLADTNAQKDKLFTLISHDLRSPISQVKMFIDLMVKNKQRYHINNEQYNLLSIVQSNIESTFNLLTDLLAWSSAQIKKTKLNKTPIAFADIMQNCIDSVHIAAANKQLQIATNNAHNISLYVDEQMARTIFRNLISNAVKFSFTGGKINISAAVQESTVVVSIQDEGVGIDTTNLNKILDPSINFSTIGTSNERGTGLGLNLCKEFIELHDGVLSIKSLPNKGTLVQVHLPIPTLQVQPLTAVNI